MHHNIQLLTFTASLSAANVGFRIALAGGPPNIKPVAFIVIIAGAVGGPTAGFAVGWLSMTLSDLYFGAGIWTIVTSSGMAVTGLLGGLLWHHVNHLSRWKMALCGGALTMLYDIGTSVTFALLFNYPYLSALVALYVPFLSGGMSPYPFGIAHELTTAILLAIIGPSIVTQVRKIYKS